jgi:inner membrane protein
VGGVVTVGAHLLADALMPMGVRPLVPFRDVKYTLDMTRTFNPLANNALLALGILAAGLMLDIGGVVADATSS